MGKGDVALLMFDSSIKQMDLDSFIYYLLFTRFTLYSHVIEAFWTKCRECEYIIYNCGLICLYCK